MTTTPEAERFGLHNGQFFAQHAHKNVSWYLNGRFIGSGDLRSADLMRIKSALKNDDCFVAYNENHGSKWQQTLDTRVVVCHDRILRPT